MSKPFTAILVSETHWDRAWYLPFQAFRLRLVRLIDRLLDILDADPAFRCFTLDGQMLPVQDYLEVRPERRADLERHIRAGRLLVGPWYALADEYLVSPEALVRNLLLGLEMACELGGAMREGYTPDAFGHISQLPQILQGFGIGSAIFWRGMGDEGEALGDQFWWAAPDGSRVLAIHLRDGYGNAANLGYPIRGGDPSAFEFDLNLALDCIRETVERLKQHSHIATLLLLNGTDHTDADPRVPEIIARANEAFPDIEIVHGSLPEYVAAVRAAIGDDLPTFQGEFNRSRYANSLQGVYSSRIYLQQANEQAQTLLECYAEPLSAWAWLLGQPYPAAFLRLAWQTLLQNHPHDDICGCSVDAVHREDMVRFAQVEQVASALARDSLRAITRRTDRTAQPGTPFIVYNPTAWPRTETVEVELNFEEATRDFYLVTADGRVVPSQRLDQKTIAVQEVNKFGFEQQVHLVLSVTGLPACGYRLYYALPGQPKSPAIEHPIQASANSLENRYLRLEIEADGTLHLLDKETGRCFHDLAYFCDDEDAGDEYDYSPCPQPERLCTLGQPATIRLLHAGPLQGAYEITHKLELPRALTADRQRRSRDRVACTITTTVTLRHNSRRIDLRTTVDNRAQDHRLRVCFPTDLQTDVAVADGHWDVLLRPIDLPAGEGWVQPPCPTRHQRYFVDLSDGQAGLAILNRGLAEYEVLRDGGRNTVALTLLRCVGYLSRDDLHTRVGHAGPGLPTPEAQCSGIHTFEYALVPHPGDWRSIYHDAYTFRAPVYVRRGTEQEGMIPTPTDPAVWGKARLRPIDLNGDLPSELSFLTLKPDSLALSAVKQSEQDSWLVIRFYNPGEGPVEARLSLFCPIQAVYELNLAEEIQKELEIQQDGTVRLMIGGWQAKTVGLQLLPY